MVYRTFCLLITRFSLKISLLKRRPDYDGAIEYYGKAALLHRNRKQLKEAAETYKKVVSSLKDR